MILCIDKTVMGFKYSDLTLAFMLNLFHFHTARSADILHCDAHKLYPCPDDKHQYCNQTSLQCTCESGFTMVGNQCELASVVPDSHTGVIALVVILTIVLIVSGIALVINKYNLIKYVRDRINARRNGEVMYEDVMIGQDDPPLSP